MSGRRATSSDGWQEQGWERRREAGRRRRWRLTPEGVLAAALPRQGRSRRCMPLRRCAAGALVPGIERAESARARSAVAASDSLGARTMFRRAPRAVTLVLPDTAVRVFVLDFDSLPAKAAEVIPVLRFRLRKMVPFDVEQAGVSYQVLSQRQERMQGADRRCCRDRFSKNTKPRCARRDMNRARCCRRAWRRWRHWRQWSRC